MEHLKCKGITLKNKNCLRNAKYDGYCINHTKQYVTLNADSWSYIILFCVETVQYYNTVLFNHKNFLQS